MDTELFKHVESGKEFAAGATIFAQGDAPAGKMFVLQEGSVDIVIDGKRCDTLGPGMLFGEMGLIDNNPRSATAVAKTNCRILPIDQQRFLFLIQNTPVFALDVMRAMANRLRSVRPN